MTDEIILTPSNDEIYIWKQGSTTKWFLYKINTLYNEMQETRTLDVSSMEKTFGMSSKKTGYLDAICDVLELLDIPQEKENESSG